MRHGENNHGNADGGDAMTDKPKLNTPIIVSLVLTEMENLPGFFRVFGLGARQDEATLRSLEEYANKHEPASSGKPPVKEA
jgi:hypothetical protein